MRIAILGRTEVLFELVDHLCHQGHTITSIATSPSAPEYTRNQDDFQQLALDLGVPFHLISKPSEIVGIYDGIHSDICISINYSFIVPSTVTSQFPLGILNLHGGDLPKYRGNACQAWAILNGESKVGLCVHRMDGDSLDSGPIIARSYLQISEATSITHILAWIAESTPTLFSEALSRLAHDPSYILSQQSTLPHDSLRCYPRRPCDGQINWSQPALSILRLIKASTSPYPGAFSYYNGKKLTIWDAELTSIAFPYLAVPGQILVATQDQVIVACGTGEIELLTTSYGDSSKMSPSFHIKSTRGRLES